MANLLLTSWCNRACPYCFAKEEIASSEAEALSWDNLIYVADFLAEAGQRHVSLLGGEPTTHPQFIDMLLYLIERRFEVTVFTNGILSPAQLEAVKRHVVPVGPQRIGFVCNLNDPVQTPASVRERRAVEAFLGAAGPMVTPGFNIYRTDFDLDFLFDAINRHGLRRNLRLGIAHPIPGRDGGFISVADIKAVVRRLYGFRDRFDALRVRPGLDCGFPACAFDDEQLGWLARFRDAAHFTCAPAFDIAPDLSLYHCFPLADYRRRSLLEFNNLNEIHEHFARLRDEIKAEAAGIYVDCDGCRQLEDGVCAGGGICQTVRGFIAEAPIRLPEIEHALAGHRHPR